MFWIDGQSFMWRSVGHTLTPPTLPSFIRSKLWNMLWVCWMDDHSVKPYTPFTLKSFIRLRNRLQNLLWVCWMDGTVIWFDLILCPSVCQVNVKFYTPFTLHSFIRTDYESCCGCVKWTEQSVMWWSNPSSVHTALFHKIKKQITGTKFVVGVLDQGFR